MVCAAGGLPGELHKLWQAGAPGGYHLEYGYSCMGYEIAGGLGVKMAQPEREVIVMVGDGTYLMMNSEIATSVMLGPEAHHRGARQSRLRLHQPAAAGDRRRAASTICSSDTRHETLPEIDFAAHAASLGAIAEKVGVDRRARDGAADAPEATTAPR